MTKEKFTSWLSQKHKEAMRGYDEARKMRREATDIEVKKDYEALQDWHNTRKNFAEDILVKLNDVRW